MSEIESFLTALKDAGIETLEQRPLGRTERLIGRSTDHLLAFEWIGPQDQPGRITLSGQMLPTAKDRAATSGALMHGLLAALLPTWQERNQWLVLGMRKLADEARKSAATSQIEQRLGGVRLLLRYQPAIRLLTLVVDLRGAQHDAVATA